VAKKITDTTSGAQCPCGSKLTGQNCCIPILEGKTKAGTAEALMRSRYTAYTFSNSDYLLGTWHPRYRPASLEFMVDQKWLGLKIMAIQSGQTGDDRGQVEFVARFKIAGRAQRLHEISQFEKFEGNWVYLHGELLD
jgi:SEC-C motif-containing protein